MIFAHIVGFNEEIKKQFISKIDYEKYYIQDIDILTNDILNEKEMKELIQRYEYYYNRSNDIKNTNQKNKELLKKAKDLETKIYIYWKNKINYNIIEIINNNNNKKKIILLGYSHFFKNEKIFIKIDTNLKLFVNLNIEEHVKTIITNNLRDYKQDIINGEFNLNYLDYGFLIKKREHLHFLYIKNGYELMILENILKNIQITDNIVPNILYYVSKNDYKKKILLQKNNKEIITYCYDWISLISIFKEYQYIKGFINDNIDKPFIQEKISNTFQHLKTSCYLYIINDTSSFVPILTKNYIYKYKTNKPIIFLEKIFIENIYDKLISLNIKLKKN
jgi:hypothetical protein